MLQPPTKFEVNRRHINQPGDRDLDLWPFDLKPGVRYCPYRWSTFLPILVFLRFFDLNLWTNNCQTDHVTLRPWPLTLEVMALVGDTGLRAPSVHQGWSSIAFPFGRYCAFTVIGLVTLTCDLLGFLGLSIVELDRGTRQTDECRTDRHRLSFYNALPYNALIEFEPTPYWLLLIIGWRLWHSRGVGIRITKSIGGGLFNSISCFQLIIVNTLELFIFEICSEY